MENGLAAVGSLGKRQRGLCDDDNKVGIASWQRVTARQGAKEHDPIHVWTRLDEPARTCTQLSKNALAVEAKDANGLPSKCVDDRTQR